MPILSGVTCSREKYSPDLRFENVEIARLLLEGTIYVKNSNYC